MCTPRMCTYTMAAAQHKGAARAGEPPEQQQLQRQRQQGEEEGQGAPDAYPNFIVALCADLLHSLSLVHTEVWQRLLADYQPS